MKIPYALKRRYWHPIPNHGLPSFVLCDSHPQMGSKMFQKSLDSAQIWNCFGDRRWSIEGSAAQELLFTCPMCFWWQRSHKSKSHSQHPGAPSSANYWGFGLGPGSFHRPPNSSYEPLSKLLILGLYRGWFTWDVMRYVKEAFMASAVFLHVAPGVVMVGLGSVH